MTSQEYSEDFLARLKAVTSLRPKRVIEHILEHGFVTTEELQTIYGYNHAPRAARDVRELGIPFETFRVRNTEGRKIGAYRFADPSELRHDRTGGRTAFSRAFKAKLVEVSGSRCYICRQTYEDRYLQIDHRVPYEVAGDIPVGSERNLDDYMLVCGSCNRAKSWSCEHCPNWVTEKSPEICLNCYWAHSESYKHIALRAMRRIDVVWTEDEIEKYEKLAKMAHEEGTPLPDYVKDILDNHVS